MKIGFFTHDQFGDLKKTLKWAGAHGFGAIEAYAGPDSKLIKINEVAKGKVAGVKRILDQSKVIISSLGWYSNPMDPNLKVREESIEYVKLLIEAAAKLGIPIVSGWIGKLSDKVDINMKLYAELWPPLVELAGKRGIKIAIENCMGNIAYKPEVWERMFEITPSPAIGLEYDPSHSVVQFIDPIEVMRKFGSRIYHTHCKDGQIIKSKLAYNGTTSDGWFHGRIPGFGDVNWAEYVSILRQNKYDYVLNIEHEDPYFGYEEGLILGQKFLSRFIS